MFSLRKLLKAREAKKLERRKARREEFMKAFEEGLYSAGPPSYEANRLMGEYLARVGRLLTVTRCGKMCSETDVKKLSIHMNFLEEGVRLSEEYMERLKTLKTYEEDIVFIRENYASYPECVLSELRRDYALHTNIIEKAGGLEQALEARGKNSACA